MEASAKPATAATVVTSRSRLEKRKGIGVFLPYGTDRAVASNRSDARPTWPLHVWRATAELHLEHYATTSANHLRRRPFRRASLLSVSSLLSTACFPASGIPGVW